jgi:S-adenosylmethionine synthetase
LSRSSFLFTSESVSEGHPDKVADQISDAIVDLFLSKDPEARVACETLTTTNLVVVAGEIRGRGIMDTRGEWSPGVKDEIEATVRRVVRDIGYEQKGFHWETFEFQNHLHPQSADIAVGVDAGGPDLVGLRRRPADRDDHGVAGRAQHGAGRRGTGPLRWPASTHRDS